MERTISIPSKIDNLRKIEKVIDEISAEFNIGEDQYGNILIAALEAANNAILHGNKLDEKKSVNITFTIEENTLNIRVQDQGPGFDFSHIPDPTAPENIENVNGRGIFLMEKLSDGIDFENNGAIVKLDFKLK
ncbi:MAG: ATP-binding protein [Bacteroidales bacterium]|nr:ATP-binding protein [Bacteroidales bacterium]MBN2821552.1 ATP-binding protein [Bacteroidales bacterium]